MSSLTPSQLGLVSWSIRVDSPQQLAQRFKAMNLKKIQLALLPIAEQPEVWGDTFSVLGDHDIRVVSGMWGLAGGVISDEHWDANVQRTKAVARIAQQHGVELISSHIGHLPQPGEPAYQQVVDRVKHLALILDHHGCQFLFETGPESSSRLCQFLVDAEAAGSPRIGINYDPGNMLIYHTDDPTAALENFLPWVVQCHLKDACAPAKGETRGQETPVGQGEVDWPAFVAILNRANYAGDLIIERERGDALEQDVAGAIELMTRLMSQPAG